MRISVKVLSLPMNQTDNNKVLSKLDKNFCQYYRIRFCLNKFIIIKIITNNLLKLYVKWKNELFNKGVESGKVATGAMTLTLQKTRSTRNVLETTKKKNKEKLQKYARILRKSDGIRIKYGCLLNREKREEQSCKQNSTED